MHAFQNLLQPIYEDGFYNIITKI